jgi:hypothetical protein
VGGWVGGWGWVGVWVGGRVGVGGWGWGLGVGEGGGGRRGEGGQPTPALKLQQASSVLLLGYGWRHVVVVFPSASHPAHQQQWCLLLAPFQVVLCALLATLSILQAHVASSAHGGAAVAAHAPVPVTAMTMWVSMQVPS